MCCYYSQILSRKSQFSLVGSCDRLGLDLLFRRFRKLSGHVDGIGSVSLLTATPYATANASIPL